MAWENIKCEISKSKEDASTKSETEPEENPKKE